MQRIYPAILTFEPEGVSVEFPDFPGCLPCGDDTTEAMNNAREALALHVYGMEQDGEEIPEPTAVSDIRTEQDQAIVLVNTFPR